MKWDRRQLPAWILFVIGALAGAVGISIPTGAAYLVSWFR